MTDNEAPDTRDKEIKPPATSGREIFRPYARILSILGDQLISSKLVAVIELVKNCYDADAEKVEVRFQGFDDGIDPPFIEIRDDGHGMSLETIQNVWMKPATPNKLNKKKSTEESDRITPKGRLMQGDKGVGRFAIYKLGNFVEIYTKTEASEEIKLTLNFRDFAQDDEFAEAEKVPERFLDQIENEWVMNEVPIMISDEPKGTVIRISDCRNSWKRADLEKLQTAFQRMIPPSIPSIAELVLPDFSVELYWNDNREPRSRLSFEEFIKIAPFKFEGAIDQVGVLSFEYSHNLKKRQGEIDLFESENTAEHDLWKLPLFKDQYLTYHDARQVQPTKIKKKAGSVTPIPSHWRVNRRPNVGPFTFYFYAFDWSEKLELKPDEKAFIRDNSVFLYRDFTRVYPYGEKGVDWLMLSKLRSEDRAGRYFSYNDLFGFIFVSQQNNPALRDAASREGLVNIDGASDDFVALIQAALKVMKDFVDVDKERDNLKRQKVIATFNEKFNKSFDALKSRLATIEDKESLILADKFLSATQSLLDEYREKVSITEELAGLGMAVEKASHDLFMLINRLRHNTDDLAKRFRRGKLPPARLEEFLSDMDEGLEFLYQEMQILQPLFRESRKAIKNISVRETFERIARYFRRDFQFDINFEVDGSEDFTVRTNLGLLLQVFINLIDNAIYWVKQKSGKRRIVVRINSRDRTVVIADSGPGIGEESADLVFREFYSRKSDGRGLGLYIAKELLDRINANVSLVTIPSFKILSGANFLIKFDEDK